MTTTQKLAELKRLIKAAEANIYRRIELATEVLHDVEWIAATHDGNEDLAIEALESDYFPDLAGFIPLGRLRQLYKAYAKKVWAEYRFNLRAMETLYHRDHETVESENRPRKSYKAEVDDLQGKLKDEERRRIVADDIAKIKERECGELTSEVDTLKEKLAHAEGRIEELQRLLQKDMATA